MMTKSPSGALSPYYYKGGYFHGIHYGSYFDDMDALQAMMAAEEDFILRSLEKRRILIDLYETRLTMNALAAFTAHIEHLTPKIYKLAISADKKTLKMLKCSLLKGCTLEKSRMFFSPDMEEGKTWLVSDSV